MPTSRLYPVLDHGFNIRDELAQQSEVVEVLPDDWPVFADEAWALKADVEESPVLEAIVIREDA